MEIRRWRALIALAVLPLTAFFCVPSPLIQVSAMPDSIAGKLNVSDAVFERAKSLSAPFAATFDLKSDRCYGWYEARDDECFSYRNFADEGIILTVAKRRKEHDAVLVLVKEARLFGKFSKGQVRDQFHQLIVAPLVREFGAHAIQVHS